MCTSYTQCTVRLCQLHSQTLKPSFLRPPHTVPGTSFSSVVYATGIEQQITHLFGQQIYTKDYMRQKREQRERDKADRERREKQAEAGKLNKDYLQCILYRAYFILVLTHAQPRLTVLLVSVQLLASWVNPPEDIHLNIRHLETMVRLGVTAQSLDYEDGPNCARERVELTWPRETTEVHVVFLCHLEVGAAFAHSQWVQSFSTGRACNSPPVVVPNYGTDLDQVVVKQPSQRCYGARVQIHINVNIPAPAMDT